MMRTIDFTPLYRSIVGFDRLADMMDSATKQEAQGYPPFNIQHVTEGEYLVELAVAGFDDDALSVTVQDSILTVTGRSGETDKTDKREFLHRGIAERAFDRRFHLADHVDVMGANLKNGMLSIRLVRELPEAAKPRQIEIKSSLDNTSSPVLERRKGKAA